MLRKTHAAPIHRCLSLCDSHSTHFRPLLAARAYAYAVPSRRASFQQRIVQQRWRKTTRSRATPAPPAACAGLALWQGDGTNNRVRDGSPFLSVSLLLYRSLSLSLFCFRLPRRTVASNRYFFVALPTRLSLNERRRLPFPRKSYPLLLWKIVSDNCAGK